VAETKHKLLFNPLHTFIITIIYLISFIFLIVACPLTTRNLFQLFFWSFRAGNVSKTSLFPRFFPIFIFISRISYVNTRAEDNKLKIWTKLRQGPQFRSNPQFGIVLPVYLQHRHLNFLKFWNTGCSGKIMFFPRYCDFSLATTG